MTKKVIDYIKLQIPAGKASLSPPVGPALDQRGLNIMGFYKAFNAATQSVGPDLPIPVVIAAFANKSFTFVMEAPPASILLKKTAGLQKNSSNSLTNKMSRLTRTQLEEIAKTKEPDLTATDSDAAVHTTAGSTRSMDLDMGGVV